MITKIKYEDCKLGLLTVVQRMEKLQPAGNESARDIVLNNSNKMHPCEEPPRGIYPSEDGCYNVLSDRSDGIVVRAAPLQHRVFCLGYSIKEPSFPAALDVRAAKNLGVPKGPLLRRLKEGKAITLPGSIPPKVVHPHEVLLGADAPGRTLVYLGDTCDSTPPPPPPPFLSLSIRLFPPPNPHAVHCLYSFPPSTLHLSGTAALPIARGAGAAPAPTLCRHTLGQPLSLNCHSLFA
jgi:hypothetical protein